jgi:hypothetical protein
VPQRVPAAPAIPAPPAAAHGQSWPPALASAGPMREPQHARLLQPAAPVVCQRVITPENKRTIGTLNRTQVLARMRRPPGKEEVGEIATAFLVAQGYANGTDEQFKQWIQLIRDAGLLDDRLVDSGEEQRNDEMADSGGSSRSTSPSPSSSARTSASASATATAMVHEPQEEKKEAAPTGLAALAKRQLSAAEAKHNEKKSTSKLQAPTMGVGRYRTADGKSKLKTSNQRNLPGTEAQARTDALEVLPSLGTSYPNMHAEMAGAFHSIQETLGGTSTKLEEMGASQQICFLCELVMSTLGVAYDEAHISKILYPKWDDPTGKFQLDGVFLTLKDVLKKLGVPEEEAKKRLVARLSKEMTADQAKAFAARILAGELQAAQTRKKLLGDLKKVPKLAAANQRKRGGGRTSASSSTKKGRRIKRELAKARKAAQMASSSAAATPDDASSSSNEEAVSHDEGEISE